MNSIIRKDYKNIFEKYLISLTFLLYLYRVTIPLLKYPFLMLYICLISYIIFRYKKRIFPSLIEFVKNYYLLLFLSVFLVVSFLLSNKLYLLIFKDVINSFILLSFFLILTVAVKTKSELKTSFISFIYLFILFAFILSLYRLSDLFTIFSGNSVAAFQTPSNLNISSLSSDYNFATLHIFLGLVSVIGLLIKDLPLLQKSIYSIFLTIYSISIFFAGSRRGAIVLLGIILALVLVQILTLLKKAHFLRQLGLNTRYFLLTLFIITTSCYYFTINSSFKTKNKALKFIGTKNYPATKERIAFAIWRYSSALDQSKSYQDIFNKIWTPVFIPEDPDSGWGSRFHRTIYPLTGKNVEIVPADAEGYLMEHTTGSEYANGSAYSVTYISKRIVDDDKILEASVFCYVSEDCDLSTVNICSIGPMGNPGANYNFQYKGSWQKLSFHVECKKGNVSVLLYLAKFGATNFLSLKGYVIYAYPQVRIFGKNDKPLSFSGKVKANNNLVSQNIGKIPNNNYLTLLTHPKQTDKIVVQFDIDSSIHRSYHPYLHDKTKIKKPNTSKYFETCFVNLNWTIFSTLIINIDDKDPIRKWASRFVSEDTTYYGYKHNLVLDTISNEFLAGRLLRWEFAKEIFIKEYNLKQKLFGGGFNFLNWYGFYFLKDKTLSDYPHNPFLSILLYSGIVGLILYFVLIYNVFRYYIIYRKEYYLFCIFFLITFFFSFFSSGSPFDPPIMGFFILLPFFIHSIHKNDIEPVIEKITNDKDINHRQR